MVRDFSWTSSPSRVGQVFLWRQMRDSIGWMVLGTHINWLECMCMRNVIDISLVRSSLSQTRLQNPCSKKRIISFKNLFLLKIRTQVSRPLYHLPGNIFWKYLACLLPGCLHGVFCHSSCRGFPALYMILLILVFRLLGPWPCNSVYPTTALHFCNDPQISKLKLNLTISNLISWRLR